MRCEDIELGRELREELDRRMKLLLADEASTDVRLQNLQKSAMLLYP
jgi:hypothetical protein